jgi:hypothetical protein
MKKIIVFSVLLIASNYLYSQDSPILKKEIKAYSVNQNYFGVIALFDSYQGSHNYNTIGGQLAFEKTINELFSIGLNGDFSKKTIDNSNSVSTIQVIGFYPHVKAHTMDLLNLPNYLDFHLNMGLRIRLGQEEENFKSTNSTLSTDVKEVYLNYGLGAKIQASPKIGFSIDYYRHNAFSVGLSIAIDKKK